MSKEHAYHDVRKHAYAEGFSSIPWNEKILDESRMKKVVRGLSKYIYEVVENGKGDTTSMEGI